MTDDLVTIEAAPLVAPPNLFGTTNPEETLARAATTAKTLTKVIQDQNLSKRIGTKDHIFVDAWTFLGSMLGVFPNVVWTRRLMDGETPLGWEARVEARTLAGQVVGSAEASCMYVERNWKGRDDFAIRSMAQTRATGKAMRLPLGFIVVLAGYAPTPYEEMPSEDLEPALRESIRRVQAKKAGGERPPGERMLAEGPSPQAPPAVQSATGLSTEEHLAEAAKRREDAAAGNWRPSPESQRYAAEAAVRQSKAAEEARLEQVTRGKATIEEKLEAIREDSRERAGRPKSVPDFCPACQAQINSYEHAEDDGTTKRYFECPNRHGNRRAMAEQGMTKEQIRKDKTVAKHFFEWVG